jgi:pro-apoptotic serine protease NMA111
MSVRVLQPTLAALQQDAYPRLRSLEVECWPQQISVARSMGLSEGWVARLTQARPHGRTALAVRRVTAGTPAATLLREGDLLLMANDRVLAGFPDLCDAESAAAFVILVHTHTHTHTHT